MYACADRTMYHPCTIAHCTVLYCGSTPLLLSLSLKDKAEDEITVGHRTFSEHLWHLSEQKLICSAKLSGR